MYPMLKTDHDFQRVLLDWYTHNGRVLPWRVKGRAHPNPYHVLLSEIMLQQTTVETVIPYFHRFLDRWPSLMALSVAPLDDLLAMWQGLGYYRRAHHLKRLADTVAHDFNGFLPASHDGLSKLPGIGPYTAAAIAAIGFGLPFVPVDGNVIRVFSRYYGIEDPMASLKKIIPTYAERHRHNPQPFDFAQALMDLGATICTPSNPLCLTCPVGAGCAARRGGMERVLPRKDPKKERPVKFSHALVLYTKTHVFLRRRPDGPGLLSGMMEVPSTPWTATLPDSDGFFWPDPRGSDTLSHGIITHVFTHFHLTVHVWSRHCLGTDGELQDTGIGHQGGAWYPMDQLPALALPTVMKKILRAAGVL